jgi:glycosyltransferase involved in cell wall biosynthesis
MKKVIFLIDTLGVGGAELSVLEVVKNMKVLQPIVCVVYHADHGLQQEFDKAGIPMVFFDIKRRFGFWEAINRFKIFINKEKPALVHATNFKSEVISRLSLLGTGLPLVGSIISDTYGKERFQLVSSRERLKLNLYKLLNRVTAFRVDQFISVSEAIVKPNMKYLGVARDKFTIIPNGRDVSLFQNKPTSRSRKELFPDIPDTSTIILSTSRVIRSKGFDEMLQALKILLDSNLDIHLIAAGDGFDLESYKHVSIKIGLAERVIFLGRRNDIPQLLFNADIFWFPSHYEGSPGVLIEAMLAKIPIIASDIPPVLENLKDGVNALICKKGDVKSLVQKTKELIGQPEKINQMTEKAYQLALAKFDIQKLTARQENIYLELIAANESRGRD